MTNAIERIEIIVGDITHLCTDIIVNSADESLLGGGFGGVDGAIHRAAGPRLREHNQTLAGCATGLSKITPAFDLTAHGIKHIIHAVGPVWQSDDTEKLGYTREDVLLASCYTRSLELAATQGCEAIAFPAISTGVYRFPGERAAKIAIGHVLGHLNKNDLPKRVVFCCFNEDDAQVYHEMIDTRNQWMFGRKRI